MTFLEKSVTESKSNGRGTKRDREIERGGGEGKKEEGETGGKEIWEQRE